MTTAAHRPLPLATLPAFTPQGTRPAPHAQGWNKALAQAQAWRWDSQPQAGKCGTLNQGPARDLAPLATDAGSGRAVPATATAVLRTGTVRATAATAPVELAASAAVSVRAFADASAPTLIRNAPASVREEAFVPLRQASQPAAPQLPHVHIEQHEGSLAVWIGIAGGQETVAVRAAAMLEELRRNLRGTDRLAQVVCNGIAIYTAPRVHKETP